MRLTQTLGLLLLLSLDLRYAEAQSDSAATLVLGRRYTQLFYADSLDPIWAAMTPEMQKVLGKEAGLEAFRTQVTEEIGPEVKVIREKLTDTLGVRLYTRIAVFERSTASFTVQWSFDSASRVAGFFIRPAREEAPSKYLSYQTKTDLRLPFRGDWYVFWGGRTIPENYHAFTTDQRFAYDLVIRRDGSTHTGDGLENKEYFCFGQPVLAPGAGSVVEAVDGIPDNRPSNMNQTQALGNHVIIDHGNGEYSFIAHFKNGTVLAKQGQQVGQGDQLGECGNSGNSSEPHVHYHLQTTAVFGKGEGLPAQFQRYYANGKWVERGEPTRGQSLRVP